MQIKEKLVDFGRFLLGSLLTCALVLISSNLDATPILERIATFHPISGEILQELLRHATSREAGSDFSPAPAQRLCWNLAGTSLDLMAILDSASFKPSAAEAMSTENSAPIGLLTEAHPLQPEDESAVSPTLTTLDCRYEDLKTNLATTVEESKPGVLFALSAERLFCETIGSMREASPAEHRVFPVLADLPQ